MASKMILNEPLPADLRQELEADAELRDITMNDAAIRILSEHFGLEWEAHSSYRPTQTERFKLRVPEELHRAIRVEAAHGLLTARGVVLNVLSEHYGTNIISPARRPRRREAV